MFYRCFLFFFERRVRGGHNWIDRDMQGHSPEAVVSGQGLNFQRGVGARVRGVGSQLPPALTEFNPCQWASDGDRIVVDRWSKG